MTVEYEGARKALLAIKIHPLTPSSNSKKFVNPDAESKSMETSRIEAGSISQSKSKIIVPS
ncbi:MAG: hypothetical protein ACI8UP_001884 [Porticoccaceae bacterium]|jgi:hypothetical protein